MEFKEVVSKRQSVRDKPVPEEIIKRVLEAARLAPSARNEQQWKFIVIRDAIKRQQLMRAANNQAQVGQAPVIIAAIALENERLMQCGVLSYAVNLGIAIEHIALAATDEGLGTCWIGAFSQDMAREALGVPGKYKIVTIMPLGYPRQLREPAPRKSAEEITCYETFTE
jgi:nitroreductase